MTESVQQKLLGKTSVRIPELGLGMWKYHAGVEPLRHGLDAGASFIDSAELYGNEDVAGEAMAGRRADVFLATKVSAAHFRHPDVLKAADASLMRLRTDYIDLYQLHKPNDDVPIEETLGAMEELVDAGKVRFIGVSNFSLEQLQRAQRATRKHPIVTNQVRFSLIDRTITTDLLPYCQANGITVIAYSPLARGFQHIVDCDSGGVLSEIAAETEKTPVQVALNWLLCLDHVVAIPKASSVQHVLENCGASGWRLSPEQIRRIDVAIRFRRRRGFETFLRNRVPTGLRDPIKRLARVLPRPLRRLLS
jgi:diketogulonate reductase-like aldo/keto reductase